MIYITDELELKFEDNVFAIYFYADWLVFHKKMKIMIEKVENYKNIKFYAVDIDDFKAVCIRYNVDSIPTVIIFKNNKEIKRIIGITLTSAFKKIFTDIYNLNGELDAKEKNNSSSSS